MTEQPQPEPDVVDPGSGTTEEPEPPTADEVLADRRLRANRATRGGLAALLCLEAFAVLLVPRAIAATSEGLSTGKTLILVALAIVLIACGFMLRRPWGVGAASVLQLVLAATIVLIPAFVVVVAFFWFVWWYLLKTRQQLVANSTGWRMFIS